MGEQITSATKGVDTHYLPGCNVYLSCLAHLIFDLWSSLSHTGSVLLSFELLDSSLVNFLPSIGPSYSSWFLHLQL